MEGGLSYINSKPQPVEFMKKVTYQYHDLGFSNTSEIGILKLGCVP
jgi:hypothetical protein